MDFLNIGPAELAFIVLLAILVIGPERTVKYAQEVGVLVTRLQREWHAARQELMSGVQTVEKEIKDATSVPSSHKPYKPQARKPDEPAVQTSSEAEEDLNEQ